MTTAVDVDEPDPAALRAELRRRWLANVPGATAFYVNFAITSMMLLIVAGVHFRAALVFAGVAIGACLVYRLLALGFELLRDEPPTDRVIIAFECAPAIAWALASTWLAESQLPPLFEGEALPDPPGPGVQERFSTSDIALLTATWGGAMIATAMYDGSRLQAIVIARVGSLVIVAVFIYLRSIDSVFALIAAAVFMAGLACGVGYLSNLRATAETRLRMQLEDARRRTQAEYARRQAIIRSVGHDLRQPLSALRMLLEPARRRLGAEDPLYVATRSGVLAAHELLDSIEQMAWLSDGRDEPQPVDVSLDRLFREVRSELDAKAAHASVRIAPTRARVFTDPIILRRILRNLLENALKYSDRDVLMGVRRRRAPSGAPSLEIWVVDRGPGVPAEEIERLFEEFARGASADVDGLGVGLAVVKDLARSLGATPVVRSRLGKGSIFGVRFGPEALGAGAPGAIP